MGMSDDFELAICTRPLDKIGSALFGAENKIMGNAEVVIHGLVDISRLYRLFRRDYGEEGAPPRARPKKTTIPFANAAAPQSSNKVVNIHANTQLQWCW
jgi:hypothetical protein